MAAWAIAIVSSSMPEAVAHASCRQANMNSSARPYMLFADNASSVGGECAAPARATARSNGNGVV